jgi:hypothetical protein
MTAIRQIHYWLKVLVLVAITTFVIPALAGIGDVDPSFGTGGHLAIPAGFGGLIGLPDGTLQLVSIQEGIARVLRLDRDGRPEQGFGVAGLLVSPISYGSAYNSFQIGTAHAMADGSTYLSVAAQNTQLLTVGGSVFASEARLVRVNRAGLPDPQFGPDGMRGFPITKVMGALFSFLEDFVIAPDGELYVLVGYYQEEYDCATGMFIYRLTPTGELDSSFGSGGEYRVDTVNNCYWGAPFQLVALAGGKLLLNSTSPLLLDAQGRLDAVPAAWQQWLQSYGETYIYDGGDYFYTANTSTGAGVHAAIARWHRDLGLDAAFGSSGTGISEFDIGGLPFMPAGAGLVQLSAPKVTNDFVYVDVTAWAAQPSDVSVAPDYIRDIVRLQSGGAVDRSYGVDGVLQTKARLNPVQQQPDGSLVAEVDSKVIRLAGASIDSPGLIMSDLYCDSGNSIVEKAGTRLIRIRRTLGSRGPVSIGFHTQGLSATPGADYTDVSGTLSWADAEVAEKTISIPILDDAIVERDEDFNITFERLTGEAVLPCEQARMVIYSDDSGMVLSTPPASPAAPVPPAAKTDSGGGGSFDVTLAGLLASLLTVRAARRRDRQSAPRFRLTVRPTRLPSP